MARDFGPFPSKPMYEVVNRRMQRALAEASGSTGFAKSGQGAVTAGTGAQLVIAAYPDGALVDGLWVENPASETVTLTTNTGSTNPRIDRLVLRLDMAAETIAPFQIVGTPAASPSAPPLVQTAAVFDMPLARYTFPGSASAQNPGSIVDERILASNNAGTSGVLAGTAAPAGMPLLIKTFYGSVVFNSNGDGTVTFPDGAFPNGLLAVHANHYSSGGPPSNDLEFVPWSATLAATNLRCYAPSGATFGGTGVAVIVTAIGW